MSWRRRSIEFFSSLALYLVLLCAWNYLRLDAFSIGPETYFAPPSNPATHLLYKLFLANHPGFQLLMGCYCLLIAGAWMLNSRLYWPLITLLCLVNLPLVPFSNRFIEFAVPIAVFGIIAYCWGQRPRNDTPQPQPASTSPAFLVAAIAILLPIALMVQVFILQPRKLLPAQEGSSAFYGSRMVNRRGAWRVEQYTQNGKQVPYPAARVLFSRSGFCEADNSPTRSVASYSASENILIAGCLPHFPYQLTYQFDGDRLQLSAPGATLSLRQDDWGPGTYHDIFPFLRR